MSYFTPGEKLRLRFEPFKPGDPPIGYMDVSHTQLSLARHSGRALVNGWHYTYFPASDELWRDDIVQMVALARACRHPGVRALIRIAFYSGMRVSEIQRAVRGGGFFALADTKNGEPRIVPMHPKCASAARVPMPRRSEIDYYWPMARDACGLSNVRLHDIRHSAATEMVNAGVDLATVGKVLGHKSHASTMRYSHHATALQMAAVGKIGRKAG